MKRFIIIYKNLSKEAKASAWFVVCNIIQKGISFFTIPIFTRLLTTEEYGMTNVYQSWMSLIIIFATLHLQYGVFNTAMIKYEKDRDRFISSLQGLSTVVTAGIFVIYFVAHKRWDSLLDLPMILMLTMFAELFTSPALGFWSGKQRFDIKYKGLVSLTLFIAVISPIIGIAMVLPAKDRGVARIIGCALINIIVGAILYIYNWRKGKSLYVKEYWMYALKFNIPLIPYYLSQMVFNQSDRLMIDYLSGRDKAGIYGVAYTLGLVLNFVINAINSSFVPWKYKCIRDKKEKEIKSVANGISVLVAVMLSMLILVTPELMRFIAGVEYYEAIWVVPPIAASLFFLFMSQLSINIEFYFGENTLLIKGSIISAAVNVILNFICIPTFGYVAAGYTTLIAYLIFCATNYNCMKKICKKEFGEENWKLYDIKFLVSLSCVFLVAMVVMTVLYPFIIARYMVLVVIMMILFLKRNMIIEKVKEIRKV